MNGASVAEVARRHDVHRNLLDAWRRQARTGPLVCEPGARMAPDSGGFSRVVVASESGMLRAVSERTVQRDWRKARLLLHRSMSAS